MNDKEQLQAHMKEIIEILSPLKEEFKELRAIENPELYCEYLKENYPIRYCLSTLEYYFGNETQNTYKTRRRVQK